MPGDHGPPALGAAEARRAFEAHVRRVVAAIADEAHALDVGWAVRTADLPQVWTLNQLCVTAPVEVAALCRLADDLQGDLGYRHVVVRHDPAADALEGPLRAAGWRVENDLVMALETLSDRAVDVDVVAELTEAELDVLMAAWLREELAAVTDEGVAQVLEYHRREGRQHDERVLGVRSEQGAPLAVAKRRIDGGLGWVEDVYTVPEARGNGFARALVTEATRDAVAARCAPVVIVADADDWPQQLYASVGFRPVGRARIFHRVEEDLG